jgi:hypothetical protein
MTTTLETSLEVNAGPHRACTACAKPSFYSLAPNTPSVRPNQGKTYAIHTWLSRAIWYCRGPRKHDNDTKGVARGQRWVITCMHCLRKAEVLLLGLKGPGRCGPTKAKHTQSTLGYPGSFGTAEGRENMTTTPETSLKVNACSLRACTACAKPRFHKMAL